jgi:hypothetical protein
MKKMTKNNREMAKISKIEEIANNNERHRASALAGKHPAKYGAGASSQRKLGVAAESAPLAAKAANAA